MRLINYIFIAFFAFFISCDLIEPEFDNILDSEFSNPPALLFSPEKYSSGVGQEVEVILHALKVEDIASMRARILYDNSKLEIVTVNPGLLFNSDAAPLFVYDDDGSGQLDIYSVFMGAERKVSGTGEIAFIKVKVTGYGDAFLEVSDESQLLDVNGNEIAIQSLGEGVISVK